MAVSAVQVVWSGWTGGPGVSTLHFDDLRGEESTTLTAVHAYYTAWTGGASATNLPSVVRIDVNPVIETFDEVTGDLEAVTSGTKPPQIVGARADSFSASTGACVTWRTGLIHNGKRVRGRTFHVPLATTTFEIDGTLAAAFLTTLSTANANFIAAAHPVIWSRPVSGTGGAFGLVVAGTVSDKTAMLTSRRD